SVIEGYAGAGKTALLQAAVQLRDQRPLLTVTPTLKAAQEARSAGSEACSLHKLLHAHGYRWNEDNQWHQLTPGETDPETGKAFYPPRPDSPHHLTGETQLVVDEAGMLEQEATRALLELADRYGAAERKQGDRDLSIATGRRALQNIAARVAPHYTAQPKSHGNRGKSAYTDQPNLVRLRDRLDDLFDRLYHAGNVPNRLT